jgi:predicted dehydrogenase
MVRIGLIGLGFMGRMHIGAYSKLDGANIVAVADKDEKRASGDLSGGWGNIGGAAESLDMTGVHGTTDFKELIALDEVDLVDICVPTPMHEELAIAALEAGKHVMCEKPLALDSASAQRITDAAAKSPGYLMPAMCMRFWPHWAWLKEAVDEGRFGRPLAATFRRVAPMPPGWFSDGESSGGALIDLHIHDTDFINYVWGTPKAVFSQGYTKTSGKTDHVVTQFQYDGDNAPIIVEAEGGWCMAEGFDFTMRYTVNFENATADFDIGREQPLILSREGKAEPIEFEGDGYFKEIEYMVDCLNSGREPSIITAADATESIRIAEAEQRSIDNGRLETL